jgi:hypothetical protein
MSHFERRKVDSMRFPTILALAIATATLPAVARAGVIPPGDPVAGSSQAELSQQWFQWAFSYPDGANPVQDTTGALSYLGDQGRYFFLAGSFGSDPVTRSATIRSDQYVFLPLANSLSMIPFFGNTEAEIRQDAADGLGIVSNLSLTLNGADVPLPPPASSLSDYLQLTPPGTFDVVIPPNAVFGIPEGTYQGVGIGYWVALAPLAPGDFQLHFTARSDGTGPYEGVVGFQDVTYDLTVTPEPAALVLGCLAVLTVSACRMGRLAFRAARR